MKPDTTRAMLNLIDTIRNTFPFNDIDANVCTGQCSSCGVKYLEYLETELLLWEQNINNGMVPKFGDIDKLAKSSQKIYRILEKNNLIDHVSF